MSTLVADEITVAYPGNKALDGVALAIRQGSVHVLVGQNGAGKSTLIKVLSGSLAPHGGSVRVDGATVHFRRPADAARIGIGVVPQELQLFPHLSVWENVTVGVGGGRGGVVRRGILRARAVDTLRALGEDVDADRSVSELTPAQQQRVTIARSMVAQTRFLIFDEPTAALSREERERLLGMIRTVAANGVGVLFVSHHLEESLEIGDEVSVLRDGRLVWTRARADVNEATLTTAMFGAALAATGDTSATTHADAPRDRPLLSVRDLRWVGGKHPLDLALYPGSVMGIAGLPGSGADTLNSALLAHAPRQGLVQLEGRRLRRRISSALRQGIGFIPSDRKSQGLFGRMSLTDNLCAPRLARYTRLGVLSSRRMRAVARSAINDLDIVATGPDALVTNLSGGNQQKVLVGRWLKAGVRVLLANEPTRGVDIATRLQIHGLLGEFAAGGGACLVYSSDLLELVDVASELLVLRREGPPLLTPGHLTPESLYELMSSTQRGPGES